MAKSLAAVVMAGGIGTRMKSATPKHLHPLLGRRMVDWVVEAARGAGVFTNRLDTALRAAQRLEFGGVTVNEAPTFRADQMPYGGVKASGNTREGPAYAVRELTEQRVVVIQL